MRKLEVRERLMRLCDNNVKKGESLSEVRREGRGSLALVWIRVAHRESVSDDQPLFSN